MNLINTEKIVQEGILAWRTQVNVLRMLTEAMVLSSMVVTSGTLNNILNRNFKSKKPFQKWVTDVTEFRVKDAYLTGLYKTSYSELTL